MAGAMELSPADEVLTKAQVKHRRKVEMQRIRRDEEKREIAQLREFVESLEKQRHALAVTRPVSALAWRNVALALDDNTATARHENQRLKRRRQELLNVIAGMAMWIAKAKGMSRVPLQSDSAANTLGVKRITLTANAACRLHGMDWMTLILYHNTDAMLQKYRFWSDWSSVVRADAFVDVSNVDDIQHVWRFQVDMPVSMATALPFVREHVVSHLNSADLSFAMIQAIDPELVSKVSPTMTYNRRLIRTSSGGVAGFNIMYREFQQAGRTVFVGQNVHDDQFTCSDLRDKAMTWIVVTGLTSTSTRVSILSLSSLMFTPQHGQVSVAEQAKFKKIPAHDDMEAEEYARIRASNGSLVYVTSAWTDYLNYAIRAAVTTASTSST